MENNNDQLKDFFNDNGKRFLKLGARIIVIILCCIAAYNYGKNTKILEQSKKQECEPTTPEITPQLWKKLYETTLKTTYCPLDSYEEYNCYYYLFDINNDEVPELITEVGLNNEDKVLDIYTIKNSDVIKILNLPFYNSHLMHQEDKIYLNYIENLKQIVYIITLEDYKISLKETYISEDIVNEERFSLPELSKESIQETTLINNYK